MSPRGYQPVSDDEGTEMSNVRSSSPVDTAASEDPIERRDQDVESASRDSRSHNYGAGLGCALCTILTVAGIVAVFKTGIDNRNRKVADSENLKFLADAAKVQHHCVKDANNQGPASVVVDGTTYYAAYCKDEPTATVLITPSEPTVDSDTTARNGSERDTEISHA